VAEGTDFTAGLNPRSLEVLGGCKLEASLAQAVPGQAIQFERVGYFVADPRDSRPGVPVFLRTVTLKDAWVRAEKRQG
jgi:glutaminyl-tRNA synthetase